MQYIFGYSFRIDHLYLGGKFIENRFTFREQKANMKGNKSSISGEVKNHVTDLNED